MNKVGIWIASLLGAVIGVSCQSEKTMKTESNENVVLENILNRKSVRRYVAEKPVEKVKVEQLLRAGMAAPSGKDQRPWEFIVVDERAKLDAMAAQLPYAKMLSGAPMAIVVCADERKSSYWYLDCSAATQNILLMAEALGLGAVWTATYPYEDRMKVVTDVLNTPSYVKSLCVIPVGYPMGEQTAKDKWDETRIHYNKWE